MKTTALLLTAFVIVTSAFAGDGNPSQLSRVQIDFNSPFREDKDYKVTRVALVAQFERNEDKVVYRFKDARPVSIVVELGKRALRIPEIIQHDITQVDLSSAHFSMGPGYSFRLAFDGKLADEPGEIVLFWRSDALREDPALKGMLFNLRDCGSRYPGIFKASP